MFKIKLIILFAVVATNATPRRLIITEITGMSMRGNTLYVPQTQTQSRSLELWYQIVCQPPADVTNVTLSWTPCPSDLETNTCFSNSTNKQSTSAATLYLKPTNAYTALNFTCSCSDALKTLEPVMFKFYQKDENMLPDHIDTDFYINATGSNSVPLSLTCKPPPHPNDANKPITWYLDDNEILKNNTRVVIQDNGTLSISYPTYLDIGVFMCRLGGDNKSPLYFFNVTGPAYIPPRHGANWLSTDLTEGSSVKIYYQIYGNPLDPNKIYWKRTFDGGTDDYKLNLQPAFVRKYHPEFADRLVFNPSIEGLKDAELELKDLIKSDRAEFTIYVENDYGKTSFTTLVRVRGKLDALWPFLGIIIEVVLLIGIIFFYERKRARQEFIEDNEFHEGKKSLTTPINETEDNLRLRKL